MVMPTPPKAPSFTLSAWMGQGCCDMTLLVARAIALVTRRSCPADGGRDGPNGADRRSGPALTLSETASTHAGPRPASTDCAGQAVPEILSHASQKERLAPSPRAPLGG